ncbi:MAG: hypothetical protein BWK78_01805 [Thiotrichaceae bacterium IS1]|nr:MAG: hypothetical protein BWK78_01805 [Thiotrichaceae bacterium IS1]
MANLEISSIKHLVDKLSQDTSCRAGRGHLYYAIKFVSEEYKTRVGLGDFLTSHKITERSTLFQDEGALIELGFPNDYLQEESGFLRNKSPRDHIPHLFITAASWIVLTFLKPEAERVPRQPAAQNDRTLSTTAIAEDHRPSVANTVGNSTRCPPPAVAPPIVRHLGLALVLKGKELGETKPNITITLNEMEDLLAKASNFLCTSQQNITQTKRELSLTEEIDLESEQQVLVIILFDSELEEGKTFANKLELTQQLRKKNPQFKVISLETLTKVSGLNKLGFVRS